MGKEAVIATLEDRFAPVGCEFCGRVLVKAFRDQDGKLYLRFVCQRCGNPQILTVSEEMDTVVPKAER